MFTRKNTLKLILNSAFGVILVFLWFKFINLAEIVGRLQTINLKWVSLFFVFFITSTTLRGARLKLLISSPIKLRQLVALNFLAQFLSFIIPIRAGEIARAIYLTNASNESVGKTIVWVLLDRFLDFWVLITLGVILGLFIQNNLPTQSIKLLLILMLGFTLAAGVIIVSSQFAKRLANGLRLKFALSIIEGFSLFNRPPLEFFSLIVLTFLAIVSDTLIWFFIFLSLGINLGFMKTLLGASLSILTFVIPSAPGYVGSAEAAGLAIWTGVVGLDPNSSSSAVVLNHLLNILALPIFGISSLYLLKFKLNLVWKTLKKE